MAWPLITELLALSLITAILPCQRLICWDYSWVEYRAGNEAAWAFSHRIYAEGTFLLYFKNRWKVLDSLDVLQVKSKTALENAAVCVWVSSGSRGVGLGLVKALLFGLMDSGPWIWTFLWCDQMMLLVLCSPGNSQLPSTGWDRGSLLSLKMIDYLFCTISDDLTWKSLCVSPCIHTCRSIHNSPT